MTTPTKRLEQASRLWDIAMELTMETVRDALAGMAVLASATATRANAANTTFICHPPTICYRSQGKRHLGTVENISSKGIELAGDDGEALLWFEVDGTDRYKIAGWLVEYENYLVRVVE